MQYTSDSPFSPQKETNLIGCNNAKEDEERGYLPQSLPLGKEKKKNERDDKTSGPNSVCLIN